MGGLALKSGKYHYLGLYKHIKIGAGVLEASNKIPGTQLFEVLNFCHYLFLEKDGSCYRCK